MLIERLTEPESWCTGMEFKKLVCENCGSNDFSYKDKFYTCNHCGTKYILADDGKYIIYNCNINLGDTYAAEDTDEEAASAKKSSGKGCLLLIGIIILFFSSCMFLNPSNEVASSVIAPKSDVKELLLKANHPKLFSTRADVKKFYEGYGRLVKLDKYDDKTIMHIDTSPVGVYSKYNDDNAKVIDIQIYPANTEKPMVINIDEAVEIAETFMPWEIVDEYYELKETKRIDYVTTSSKERYYDISYALKEKYSTAYKEQKHNYPGSVGIRINTDMNDKVKLIRLATHLPSLGLRFDNGYKFSDWKPQKWHEAVKEPSSFEQSWQFLSAAKHPRLLADYEQMLDFGKNFNEEAVYFEHKYTHEKYGINGKKMLLYVEGAQRDDKSNYVFSIDINLHKLAEFKKVSLAEAIELTKSFLPYDIMQKYYTLNFARKKVPTDKNLQGSTVYQVVYDRVVPNEMRAEAKKLDLPRNIRISLQEDDGGYISEIIISGYTYLPKNTSLYERATNEYGERIEIRYAGKILGPYEESDDWYTVQRWENPF